jgi:hypothetical protein
LPALPVTVVFESDSINNSGPWQQGIYEKRIAFFSWLQVRAGIGDSHSTPETIRRVLEENPEVVSNRKKIVADGQDYLNHFLALGTPQDALLLLNTFGNPVLPIDEAPWRVLWDEMIAFQRDLRLMLVTPLKDWPELTSRLKYPDLIVDPPVVDLEIRDGCLQGAFHADEGWWACAAALWLRKAEGAEYKLCARTDCQQWFRLETQHPRKYCSSACAHVCAVRAARRRNATTLEERRKVPRRSARSKHVE